VLSFHPAAVAGCTGVTDGQTTLWKYVTIAGIVDAFGDAA